LKKDNENVLIINGVYLTPPYIMRDEGLQTNFIMFECDKSFKDLEGLNLSLDKFNDGEPVMIVIISKDGVED